MLRLQRRPRLPWRRRRRRQPAMPTAASVAVATTPAPATEQPRRDQAQPFALRVAPPHKRRADWVGAGAASRHAARPAAAAATAAANNAHVGWLASGFPQRLPRPAAQPGHAARAVHRPRHVLLLQQRWRRQQQGRLLWKQPRRQKRTALPAARCCLLVCVRQCALVHTQQRRHRPGVL
eukprot:356586-Chlamydomonas_euryale.AAC.1